MYRTFRSVPDFSTTRYVLSNSGVYIKFSLGNKLAQVLSPSILTSTILINALYQRVLLAQYLLAPIIVNGVLRDDAPGVIHFTMHHSSIQLRSDGR